MSFVAWKHLQQFFDAQTQDTDGLLRLELYQLLNAYREKLLIFSTFTLYHEFLNNSNTFWVLIYKMEKIPFLFLFHIDEAISCVETLTV